MKLRVLRKVRQDMHGHPDLDTYRDRWAKHYSMNNAFNPVFIPAGSIRCRYISWRREAWRGLK